MQEIKTSKAPSAIGPYSQGIICGEMIYVSGQIPVSAVDGEMVQEIKAATKQAIKNVQAILEECGSSLDKVCKTTVYMKTLADFIPMNEEYAKHFQPPYPARACIEVSRLPKDAAIEIECIAKK